MSKKYRVVCYMRIDCEETEDVPMTLEEAEAEANNLSLIHWENHYEIEEVESTDPETFS